MSTDSIMVRLRRANPVPRAARAEDAELLARITALQADPRLTAPAQRPRRRRALVLALAIGLTALLASTAFAVSHWIGGDVVRLSVTKREYLAAQKQLTLPPGYAWPRFRFPPDAARIVTSRGAGGGQAVLTAQNAWECYWVDAIRRDDVAAAQRAHARLNGLLARNFYEAPAGAPENWAPTPLPTKPFAVFAHDGGLDWVRATYRQAAAGDARNLAQSCRANAPR
jgi:hypothetical protein